MIFDALFYLIFGIITYLSIIPLGFAVGIIIEVIENKKSNQLSLRFILKNTFKFILYSLIFCSFICLLFKIWQIYF